MKELKLAIAGLGVLGIIGIFLPMGEIAGQSISYWKVREFDGGNFWMVVAGFVVPIAMAGMAIAQGAMVRWQAGVAAAGFALAALKLREAFEAGLGGKVMLIAAVLGLVAAIVAIVKTEKAA